MKLYERLKITVNADGLAKGLLSMVDDMEECYANALKLGMLPAPLLDSFRENLEAKLRDDMTIYSLDDSPTDLDSKLHASNEHGQFDFTMRQLIASIEGDVTKAMYRHADMLV